MLVPDHLSWRLEFYKFKEFMFFRGGHSPGDHRELSSLLGEQLTSILKEKRKESLLNGKLYRQTILIYFGASDEINTSKRH